MRVAPGILVHDGPQFVQVRNMPTHWTDVSVIIHRWRIVVQAKEGKHRIVVAKLTKTLVRARNRVIVGRNDILLPLLLRQSCPYCIPVRKVCRTQVFCEPALVADLNRRVSVTIERNGRAAAPLGLKLTFAEKHQKLEQIRDVHASTHVKVRNKGAHLTKLGDLVEVGSLTAKLTAIHLAGSIVHEQNKKTQGKDMFHSWKSLSKDRPHGNKKISVRAGYSQG